MSDYSQYEELIPFMDEPSLIYLADCIRTGASPVFSPLQLVEWSMLASEHKRRQAEKWKQIKENNRCKTKGVKK